MTPAMKWPWLAVAVAVAGAAAGYVAGLTTCGACTLSFLLWYLAFGSH
jgi:hypothetical protein